MASSDVYSLLVDESCNYSRQDALRSALLAHLIYSLIVNDTIVVSDNQIVTSSNLRYLMRHHGVVRELAKHGSFGLAIRTLPDGQADNLSHVHQAFLNENKIKSGDYSYALGPEIEFFERYAIARPWTYEAVRENFTRNCELTLSAHFRDKLNPSQFDAFSGLIDAEKERDGGGLGRVFFRNRLAAQMREASLPDDQDLEETIRLCTDAPYVSNLPSLMALNPIYAVEHAGSFNLLGGRTEQAEDVAKPHTYRPLLNSNLYVAGLGALYIDDILDLRQTVARREFVRLQAEPLSHSGQLHDLAIAYSELEVEIQKKIISRIGSAGELSPEGERRVVRQQHARIFDIATGIASQVFSLAVTLPAALGLPGKWLFDKAKDKLVAATSDRIRHGPHGQRPHFEGAAHKVALDRLDQEMKQRGTTDRIVHEEQTATLDFKRETIVS